MRFSQTYMKMCKPVYRLGTFLIRIGMIVIPVGLILGLAGRRWVALFVGIGCVLIGSSVASFPNFYLVHFIKMYDEGITSKDATKIAQIHLREKRGTGQETKYFIYNIMGGCEREKRLQNNDLSSKKL